MQIVSDSGMDLFAGQRAGLDVHVIPLLLTLEARTYRSGVDITPEDFYRLLEKSSDFPTTARPAPKQFAALYRRLAATDPEILPIHISSGLSRTLQAAHQGAEMVPEARVTFFDTKTLSAAQGWHVEAAARAVRAGWPLPRVLSLLECVSAFSDLLFTLETLKYLVHGGRISHLKGLVASVLDIKPMMAVEKGTGTYIQRGVERTFQRAILGLADLIARQYPPGSALRVQIFHGASPEGAALLHERLDHLFRCAWLPDGPIAPVLGAHTGPGLVGVAYGPQEAFVGVP